MIKQTQNNKLTKVELIILVKKLSNNYTTIIDRIILTNYNDLNWGSY